MGTPPATIRMLEAVAFNSFGIFATPLEYDLNEIDGFLNVEITSHKSRNWGET